MYLKKLGCIIFARSNSKRLNEKVLKEINGIPLILIVYSRVKKIFPKEKIVIATSRNKFDDRLVKICKKKLKEIRTNYFRPKTFIFSLKLMLSSYCT